MPALPAVQGLAGGLRSAVAVIQAKYMATGDLTATSVDTTGGGSVTVAAGTGIPTGDAAGIGAAMQSIEGFTADYTSPTAVTFRPTNGGSATCQATYDDSTGAVTVDTSGC